MRFKIHVTAHRRAKALRIHFLLSHINQLVIVVGMESTFNHTNIVSILYKRADGKTMDKENVDNS